MASITTYAEERLRGDKRTYKKATEDVPDGQNTCHSIKVDSGEWLVYCKNNFEAPSFRLKSTGPPGIYPNPGSIRSRHCGSNSDYDHQVRSLRPINQGAITLFDKDAFCGAEKAYTSDSPSVEMDNCCSIIVRGCWWAVYPYGDYTGSYDWCNQPVLYLAPGSNFRVPILAPGNEKITVGSIQKIECPY